MDLRGYYEGIAISEADYSDIITGRHRKVAQVFSKHLSNVGRLLDIGCGSGASTAYLKHAIGARKAYGVDISETAIKAACDRGIEAVALDINHHKLPFDDNCFDAIFAGEVIEHVFDTDGLLDEIDRILTHEGLCVLTTPNLASWVNRLGLLLGWQPFWTEVSPRHDVGKPKFLKHKFGAGHMRVFTYGALKELLLLHGFKIVEAQGLSISDTSFYKPVPGIFLTLHRLLYPIDKFFLILPTTSNAILVAFGKV